MPIAEILHQIDAYLFSLRQARDLLSAPIKEVPHEKAPRQKRKIKIKKTTAAASAKPHAPKKKTRSGAPVAERSTVKKRVRVPSMQQVRSSLPPPAPKQEQQNLIEATAPAVPLAAAPQQTISTELLPTPKRVRPARSVRRTAPKPIADSKLEIVKPAIALAGSMNSKIVVVSAEQARQERNRTAAPPEVRRPRLPSTGLSGKLAFEALFKDSSDSSTS